MNIKDKKEIFDSPYLDKNFIQAETELGNLLKTSPIPNNELAENTNLYVSPRTIKRQLFFNHLYQKNLELHGDVFLFGLRWGRELSLIESLRTIYEPYNSSRKIIGFDSFTGFPEVTQKDKSSCSPNLEAGNLSTTPNYLNHLSDVLNTRRRLDPLPNIERTFIVEGDATKTLEDYLKKHTETIISFAYFDFDLFEPTLECLKMISPYLTKGAIIGFDELNSIVCPGETVALRELLGLKNYKVNRSRDFSGHGSYIIWE
tara:strand:+ start:7205 stop:7981 length:777 start_codon:yes stop_codon:yes gene_type:complete